MTTPHIALISDTPNVDLSALVQVSAAIQKQITRDFAPFWNVIATVDAFASQETIPLDYWRVAIRDDIGVPGQAGFHRTKLNQPYALVQFDENWTVTASHEVLEMLVDPSGNRLVAGASAADSKKRVNYLVEVCDPVQASSYSVNDIRVCDFYTPAYFDPVGTSGGRYCYSGKLTSPRSLLKEGYLAFFDPSDSHWYQWEWFGTKKPKLIDLGLDTVGPVGALRRQDECLREMIDRLSRGSSKTPRTKKKTVKSSSSAMTSNARQFEEEVNNRLRSLSGGS